MLIGDNHGRHYNSSSSCSYLDNIEGVMLDILPGVPINLEHAVYNSGKIKCRDVKVSRKNDILVKL